MMGDGFHGYYASPIGTLKLTLSEKGLSSLVFTDEKGKTDKDDMFLLPYYSQLDAYFGGTLRTFDLKLDPAGTDFQQSVWKYLQTIPYGQTVTYQEVAGFLGNPRSSRAVGHANGVNPVAIIIPCHRVIGSNGSLTGYAGGLWRKQWLLEHEMHSKQLSLF